MIKVEHTKTIKLSEYTNNLIGLRLVDDAELVLIPIEYNYVDKVIIKVNNSYYKPILISRTEKIEVGDWYYETLTKSIKQNIDLPSEFFIKYNQENSTKAFKILALPEHFSSQQLQDIVDGKLKEGKYLVECWSAAYCDGCNKVGMRHWAHADTCGYPVEYDKIKLNPHITIYPVEEKMYTREELLDVLKKHHERFVTNHPIGDIMWKQTKEWFEQKVK